VVGERIEHTGVEGREGPIAVEPPDLDGYLGKPPFKTETPMSGVGVVILVCS
jgi:ATP-dependent Lon protease